MFERHIARTIRTRLAEPRRFIQVLQGPRQTGKTTAIRQALDSLPFPTVYESADTSYAGDWAGIEQAWRHARDIHHQTGEPVALALDEIQKLPRWTEVVKALWDDDTWRGTDVRVALLGSSPLLLGRGLRESMSGRYEIVRATHWTWPECRDAFGWNLEQYVFFGGYPGAATLLDDEGRWRSYVTDVVMESTIARDVLHMSRVDKPAVMRRVAFIAAEYSGRELSYTKMLGQLDDAGNATTVAHYLDLLDASGMATGLQKWAGEPFRRRASTPKLLVHNTGLMSAVSPRSFRAAIQDKEWWGRLVETCVGAHLLTQVRSSLGDGLYYWRDRNKEVDFVLRSGARLIGVEVKSGAHASDGRGLDEFKRRFGEHIPTLIVGTGGIGLQEFLEMDLVRV